MTNKRLPIDQIIARGNSAQFKQRLEEQRVHNRAACRAYYHRNRAAHRERCRNWEKRHRPRRRSINLRYYHRHPQRSAARRSVTTAVAIGEMRPAAECFCAYCGAPAAEWHHHLGYEADKILAVIPLCLSCHLAAHGKKRIKE